MPVNIAITFLVGSSLGWIACKILKPPQHFRGLIIAFCSAGTVVPDVDLPHTEFYGADIMVLTVSAIIQKLQEILGTSC
jgi:hypothetical protein